MIDKVIFVINGNQYTWCGWYGCQLKSIERKFPAGTRRSILETEFGIYSQVRVGLFDYETKWHMIDLSPNITEANVQIYAFKDKLRKLI